MSRRRRHAISSLNLAGEKCPEKYFDDLAREREYGLQFHAQASQQSDDLGQVLVDASGNVQVHSKTALLRRLTVSQVAAVERRDACGKQDEIPLGRLHGDRRPTFFFSPPKVDKEKPNGG